MNEHSSAIAAVPPREPGCANCAAPPAAGWYLLFPVWNGWLRTGTGGQVVFVSATGLAVAVPLWAFFVQLALLCRRLHYEVAFTFSAHYHAAYLILYTVAGCLAVMLSRVEVPRWAVWVPVALFAWVAAPLYLFIAFRHAFRVGRSRSILATGFLWVRVTVMTIRAQPPGC